MIIDSYYPDGEWDQVGRPHIYLRTRDKTGKQTITVVNPNEVEEGNAYIPPHCWIPVGTHPRKLSRVVARYPGTVCRDNIQTTGNDGNKLMRLDVTEPSVLYDIKRELKTYEAECPYEDQFLFNLYPKTEDMPEFEPRIWYFDMEWQPCDPHEGAITMIAIDDTHADYPMVFSWQSDGDYDMSPAYAHMQAEFIDREGGYHLYQCKDEEDMLQAFLYHLGECDPDILIAHAMMWADLPKLVERLGDDAGRLSPLNQVIRPRKKVGYRETQQPILGRLCFDTALHWSTGGGLEHIWQKSGNGQFRSRKLADIAEDLKLTEEFGEQGAKMDADVFTWWVENFDEFVDYCVRDTTLLRRCTEKVKAIPFHLALQKFCGVQFRSTHNVTNFLRGLFARRTPLKAPSLYNRQREELTAATVAKTVPGRHKGVALLDFASMYPFIIIGSNLCVTTKEKRAGENIRVVPNGTYWSTEKKGILPSIVEDMIALRKEYKRMMVEAKTDEEVFQYDMLQQAVKVCTNACYGYVSQRKVGGGWIDPDIGATITYYGRECVNTLLTESENKGYKALAGHTDSGYIQVPFEEAEAHVAHLNKAVKEKLDLPMDVEFEAYFEYWTTADAKNRNFGYITWPESKKGNLKVTGFAYKASNASPLTKLVHGKIFNLVGHGAEEEAVNEALRPIALKALKEEISIDEMAPWGRIGKDKAEYKMTPPMAVRAGFYYNDYMKPTEPFRTGDSVRWVYVKGAPTGLPYTNVVGFRKVDEIEDFVIDYPLCVEKFIRNKIKRLYNVLEWDLDYASGARMPKKHW